MNTEPFSTYDVAIVGAGPAGSSAAIRLASAGLNVLIVEQKQFPRSKLCGEFISPECLTHFAELGVLDEMSVSGGVPIIQTVFYAQNAKALVVPNDWFRPGSRALGLSRAEMDSRLLDGARAAGTRIMEKTHAAGLLIENGTVCGLELRDHERTPFCVKAHLTIDATGRVRALARVIEKANGRARRQRADYVAFKTHLDEAIVPDGDCEIYAYRGGYGGCNRVENGRYNLCFIVSASIAKNYGGDPAEIMRKVVFANKRAKRSLSGAVIADEWLAVPIESYGRADLSPMDGLLAIGDAAAFIDPFTGSGILLALESAKIAAGIITSESSSSFPAIAAEYKRQYSAAFNSRLKVCSMLRYAAFVPYLAGATIRSLALSDRLTRRLARATRH